MTTQRNSPVACRVDALRALLDAGADANARAFDGITVVHEVFMQVG